MGAICGGDSRIEEAASQTNIQRRTAKLDELNVYLDQVLDEFYTERPRLKPSFNFSRTKPKKTMERWVGRVAVVTGASSGIGAAVAKELVKQGMKVVGVARRRERIEALRNELGDASGELYALHGDLSKEEQVADVFSWIKRHLGGIDVLVNSAGITGRSTLQEGPVSAWQAELKKELSGAPGSLHSLKADVSKEEDIISAFSWIKKNFGGVDVLINNAGIVGTSTLHDGPVSNWRALFDLNVIGLSLCTKEALQSMKERGVDDGHIIHISSINGHGIPGHSLEFGLMMYSATKNSVTILTEGLRKELAEKKSKIRVTAISPGMVWTDIMVASGYKLEEGQTVADIYKDIPHLKSQDIADAVTYVLGAPPHVQIHEIIIKPVGEAF
ncbi:hypothetical protein C0J52_23194 [Blattella germanica]|nr:hypothetical protein C0J52_23194 [Blattella germanica]